MEQLDEILAHLENLERRFQDLFLLVYAIRGAVEQRGIPPAEIQARIDDLRRLGEEAGRKAANDVKNRKPQ